MLKKMNVKMNWPSNGVHWPESVATQSNVESFQRYNHQIQRVKH